MASEFEEINEVKFLNPKLGFLRNGLLPKKGRGKGKRTGMAAARSVTGSLGNPANAEDGDGDGLIFDGTPQERPAVNAVTDLVGDAAQAASTASGVSPSRGSGAGQSDRSGTTGLNANNRVRQMAGRMGAKKPTKKGRGPKWYWDEPKPDYRTTGEKVRDTVFGAFDLQRPNPKKVRATEEEITDARQLRAARASDRAKAVAKRIRTEMSDPSNAFSWEDRTIIAQQFLDDNGIDLDGLSPEDRAEVIDEAARILAATDELGNDLTEYKPRTDGVSQRKARELTTIVADRSPVMAELMEREGGTPRVMIIDDFGSEMEEVMDAPASVLREVVDAFYHRDGDMIALNGRFMDADMDEPDTVPNEYGFGRIGTSMDTVFRHEYGHRMMWQAVFNGTEEQADAVDKIIAYYEQHHKPHKERRKTLAQVYGEDGEEAAKELLGLMQGRGTSSRSGPNEGIEATMWMTEYGHTNRSEFMAELFAMATSQNPDVRNSIPEELRPLVEQWLGVSNPDAPKPSRLKPTQRPTGLSASRASGGPAGILGDAADSAKGAASKGAPSKPVAKGDLVQEPVDLPDVPYTFAPVQKHRNEGNATRFSIEAAQKAVDNPPTVADYLVGPPGSDALYTPEEAEEANKRLKESAERQLETAKANVERLEALKEPRVSVRMPVDALEKFLEEDSFKTQGGGSQFGLPEGIEGLGGGSTELRINGEEFAMGVPRDFDGPRPIYGFVDDDKGDTATMNYGDVIVRLKPDVVQRSTMTFGDSLSSMVSPNDSVTPIPLTEAGEASAERLTEAVSTNGPWWDPKKSYMEAQIHGGLKAGDVEALDLDSRELNKSSVFYGQTKMTPEDYDRYAEISRRSGIPLILRGPARDQTQEQYEKWLKDNADVLHPSMIQTAKD